jgi:competence protein ComEC
MTHLLAVSGTNLTIILGGLLLLARWIRVRAYGLPLVGLFGVVGFVLLAGPEPSVLRAAAMGTVGVMAMGRAGPGNGVRALGLAVLVLVLAMPGLAVSIGFVLSIVATGGILVLGPPLRDALGRWLPRWPAEAVAVPLAAQLACTPVVAAFSGQVSLVAVAANIAAAPFVAPATVLGLAGGLIGLLDQTLGRLVAAPACWCADAIIAIAHRSADLPVPAVEGVASVSGLVIVLMVSVALARYLPRILRQPVTTVGAVALLVGAVLVPVPTPGWPPHGWLLHACDVGQGDALLLRTGAHSAVVVDAGPDPRPVDRCLGRLGIGKVPVVVLTHFHADHVDGLTGVLRGRDVGRIDVSPLAEPADGVADVRRHAAARGLPVRAVTAGERTTVGPVHWQVLGPLREHPDSASPPNDASVVLLVETAGIRILMLGDAEPPEQGDLRRAWPGLRADVLKVAHHGSARQDEELVGGLGARVALVSAGRDNDYGHPAPSTLDLLGRAGMRVLRTDRGGDVAVVLDGDRLATVARGR